MAVAFLGLIFCQLIGELIREALHLPIPGPVIGMFLLAGILSWRLRAAPDKGLPKSFETLAEGLITNLGLLFVPAGVGIIAESGLLCEYWFPIVVGLLGSTILSAAATGLVMHWTMQPSRNSKARPPSFAADHSPE